MGCNPSGVSQKVITMIAAQNKKRNIWSVIERQGNYKAQVTEANGQAKMEGWRVVFTDLTVSEACEYRDSLKHSDGIAADLSDLLFQDFAVTEDDTIDTFDTIYVQCRDGIYRTGVVLRWNSRTVYIEVGTTVYPAKKSTAKLICKVDETDEYELDTEYDAWSEALDTEVSQTFGVVA